MSNRPENIDEYKVPPKGYISHKEEYESAPPTPKHYTPPLGPISPKEWERKNVHDSTVFTNLEQGEKVNPIKPNYYRREIKGVEIDVIDIIQAWGIGFLLGNTLKYILRAGQKEGNSKEQDLRKGIENIKRELGE